MNLIVKLKKKNKVNSKLNSHNKNGKRLEMSDQ